jgi:hypothetical protein
MLDSALRTSRRTFLAASALSLTAAGAPAQERRSDDCLRCNGVGLVPLADAKPFVWVEGTAAPKPETVVGEQHCPQCHPGGDPAELVAAAKERIDRALASHDQWKEQVGGKLLLVLTRHAALSTQFTPAQAKAAGQAVENLTLHLKRTAKSLALTPTRLGEYELFLLWEKPAWEKFRKVMEERYTLQQLGEGWSLARDYQSYDHVGTPHLYETPQTVRQRPITHGPVFLAGRRQINLAANWHAPEWLAEGFAEYGDYSVHKANRWFTVYHTSQPPPVGDWLAEARRLAAQSEFRPWEKFIRRELRDWQANDYTQALGMATFLLESEPGKFIAFLKLLASGDDAITVLEQAYRQKMEDLEQRCTKWLAARR